MTTCNFDVYCENGVLKGDGLCFVQCCLTGNICDACKKITYEYFVTDNRKKIVVGYVLFSPAIPTCPHDGFDLGIPGSWECVEIREPNYPYKLNEVRCVFYGSDCLCDAGDLITQIAEELEEKLIECSNGAGAGVDQVGLEDCCIGCCKPSNDDPPFASTNSDCARLADDQSAAWYPCGCDESGEPINIEDDNDCSYEEPEGEKIGGCCSKATINYELLNPECSGINTAGGGECPEFIQLSKLCNKEPENILITPEGFPNYCNIQPSDPRTISIIPEILLSVEHPTSDCCEITCCNGACPTLTTSILRKKIIGNKLKLKLNKKEIIRRIRNNIRKRRTR
jgi:hypothetical protein